MNALLGDDSEPALFEEIIDLAPVVAFRVVS